MVFFIDMLTNKHKSVYIFGWNCLQIWIYKLFKQTCIRKFCNRDCFQCTPYNWLKLQFLRRFFLKIFVFFKHRRRTIFATIALKSLFIFFSQSIMHKYDMTFNSQKNIYYANWNLQQIFICLSKKEHHRCKICSF